ncbi:MAG: rRNA maturation RNase YbeY [Paracoccaceae bacterium]|nr:rRNA maturation RNase YbeY [Paracoccaceae bacterium]
MRRLVDTVIEDARWQGADLASVSEVASRAALAALGLDPDNFELCLMGCSDARIAELNGDFRAKPAATNVLSWPSAERGAAVEGAKPELPRASAAMPAELGDIAIAWETCNREADEQRKTLHNHVTHLIVHATLHLLGYDHIREGDATLMEKSETGILASLGVADPYS